MFKLLSFFHRVRYDPMVSDRPDVPYLTRFQNIRSDPGRAGLLMPVMMPSSAHKQKIVHVFFQKRAIELQTAVWTVTQYMQ